MSQKISNSTEALVGLLVLSITAKTEQHSRMATRSASQLIKRFRIPVDLVESCKTYVEQIMADHRSKFFVVDGRRSDSVIEFTSAEARGTYVSNTPGTFAVGIEHSWPALINRISRCTATSVCQSIAPKP